jgi:predicted amidophosphoribosyltransferase
MLNAPTFNPQSPAYLGNMIIAYLGRNVKEYRKNCLQFLERLDLICPKCGGRTSFHASYHRHVHIGEEIEWINLFRVICNKCGKTHAIIPDFIRPYKHYSACDTEMALRDQEDSIPFEEIETTASISTLRRWVTEFKHRGRQAAGALRSILYRHYGRLMNEIEAASIKVFHMIEQMLELLPEVESSHLAIGEANMWLTNHMAGVFV